MRSRKEKPIFRNLTIAAAGDLGRAGGSAQWTDANIARWVGLREGRFVRAPGSGAALNTPTTTAAAAAAAAAAGGSGSGSGNRNGNGNGNGKEGRGKGKDGKDGKEGGWLLGEDVTHVVCSKEEFRRGGWLVKMALKHKSCEIVTLDWLEDSMLKGRRLPEEVYSHRKALERERRKELMRLRVLKGLEKAVREVNPNLYHPYRDHTFFQYEVTITRNDEEQGIQGERYVLSIFESNNAKPHLYWFVAKFYKKKGDSQPKIHRPSHAPGAFAREFALFESFFHVKTGIPWAQRLVKAGTTGKSLFQYQPPTGGKPVGWVPAAFMLAEAPDGAVSKMRADTAAAAVADDNRSAGPKGSHTAVKPSNAPVMPHQKTHQALITPAPSPRPDEATAADRHQQGGKHSLFARPSSWSAPKPRLVIDLTDD